MGKSRGGKPRGTKQPNKAEKNCDVTTLPKSVPALLFHGTVLIHKLWANELLQMGFGSFCGKSNSEDAEELNRNGTSPGNIADEYTLILHDEEALYLLEVGVVEIVQYQFSPNNSESVVLDDTSLLQLFTRKRSSFPVYYKVYHYFKSRGYVFFSFYFSSRKVAILRYDFTLKFRFVVRLGMNFGMDYSIYRLSPTKCHSEICVQVIDARKSGEDIDPLLSWRNISTLTRVMPVM